MKNVNIIGVTFPVTEDTDPADHPSWCDAYTTALKAAFAANPSSAFPVPTAADEGDQLIVKGGLPVWDPHRMVGGFFSMTSAGAVAAGSTYAITIPFPAGFTGANSRLVANWVAGSTPSPGYNAAPTAGLQARAVVHGASASGWVVSVFFPVAYTVDTRPNIDGISWIALKV